MSAQLDILALEPFYGGERRALLEAVVRCSRHRWTLLKLPPRRMDRRVATAGLWFAEQLSRQAGGAADLLFASDTMNLGDLFRRVPALSRKPSVVYFHANQLPPASSVVDGPHDLVYLSTANAASEMWFNSKFHLHDFYERLGGLFERHPDLGGPSMTAQLRGKSRLMAAPVETVEPLPPARPDSRVVLVDLADGQMDLLNRTLMRLLELKEEFQLLVLGTAAGLDERLPHRVIADTEEAARQAAAEAGTYLSVKPQAMQDHHLIRALAAGAWPVVPGSGVYPELIPPALHRACLHDGSPGVLAERLQDAWQFRSEAAQEQTLRQIPQQFEVLGRCREIDQCLEQIALDNMLMG